jgi:hypothetical protein
MLPLKLRTRAHGTQQRTDHTSKPPTPGMRVQHCQGHGMRASTRVTMCTTHRIACMQQPQQQMLACEEEGIRRSRCTACCCRILAHQAAWQIAGLLMLDTPGDCHHAALHAAAASLHTRQPHNMQDFRCWTRLVTAHQTAVPTATDGPCLNPCTNFTQRCHMMMMPMLSQNDIATPPNMPHCDSALHANTATSDLRTSCVHMLYCLTRGCQHNALQAQRHAPMPSPQTQPMQPARAYAGK